MFVPQVNIEQSKAYDGTIVFKFYGCCTKNSHTTVIQVKNSYNPIEQYVTTDLNDTSIQLRCGLNETEKGSLSLNI